MWYYFLYAVCSFDIFWILCVHTVRNKMANYSTNWKLGWNIMNIKDIHTIIVGKNHFWKPPSSTFPDLQFWGWSLYLHHQASFHSIWPVHARRHGESRELQAHVCSEQQVHRPFRWVSYVPYVLYTIMQEFIDNEF